MAAGPTDAPTIRVDLYSARCRDLGRAAVGREVRVEAVPRSFTAGHVGDVFALLPAGGAARNSDLVGRRSSHDAD